MPPRRIPQRKNKPGAGRRKGSKNAAVRVDTHPDAPAALALVDAGASPEEAAEQLTAQGKPIHTDTVYQAIKRREIAAKPAGASVEAKPTEPAKEKPAPVVAEQPPAHLVGVARRLWIIDERINEVRNALAQARSEQSTRTAGLEKQLREWLTDRAKIEPPSPPDPATEEKRWREQSDSAIAKIKAGCGEARERMGALIGRPFPYTADVVTG